MRALVKAALAAASVFALTGCIVVADGDHGDGDDSWTDRAVARASSGGGVYLLFPFDVIEAEGAHHVFYHDVVPALTRDHAMINAGTADAPWYCFAYTSETAAEAGRNVVAGFEGGAPLADGALVDETCAAG